MTSQYYAWLLAAVLFLSALILVFRNQPVHSVATENGDAVAHDNGDPAGNGKFVAEIPVFKPLAAGALLGFVSGAVGIGGGVFLSPLIIFCKWADTKTTSATAAVFILANSIAGLLGRALNHTLVFGDLTWLMLASLAGALLGSTWGARLSTASNLRLVLAAVLAIASIRLLGGS
jgi:hypothetical protein